MKYQSGQKNLLTESSLTRFVNHQKEGMIIISPNRSEIFTDNWQSLKELYQKWLNDNKRQDNENSQIAFLNYYNKSTDIALEKILKDNNEYTYIRTKGGYTNLETGEKADSEKSYIIFNVNRKGEVQDFDKLVNFGKILCEEFKQDCFYVQAPNKPPIYMDKEGNKINSSESDNYQFNRTCEYFTKLGRNKNAKTFSADIKFENDEFNDFKLYSDHYIGSPIAYGFEKLKADNVDIEFLK